MALFDSEADPHEPPFVCPHCRAGALRLKRVLYARWHGGQFITMPNFPGWECDVCGSCEYDPDTLEHLRLLLGPAAEGTRKDDDREPGQDWPNPDFGRDSHPSGRRRV